jgi:hypothetical protein
MRYKNIIIIVIALISRAKSFGQSDSMSDILPDNHSTIRIAILPVSFVSNDRWDESEMGYRLQWEAFEYLRKEALVYYIQNPDYTNASLLKNNIKPDDIRAYSIQELSTLLQVEYIIRVEVTQTKSKIFREYRGYRRRDRFAPRWRTSDVYIEDDYSNYVTVKLNHTQGQNIYNQSRKSLLGSRDGYRVTMQYLLKRLPIYKK